MFTISAKGLCTFYIIDLSEKIFREAQPYAQICKVIPAYEDKVLLLSCFLREKKRSKEYK